MVFVVARVPLKYKKVSIACCQVPSVIRFTIMKAVVALFLRVWM